MGDELLDLFHRSQVYSSFLVMLTLQTSFVLFSKDKVTWCIRWLFFSSFLFILVFLQPAPVDTEREMVSVGIAVV